jgi:hypothetical protein
VSISAGAIHAAAIGVHAEHRQAVWAFTAVAALQLGWGALALTRGNRFVALAGVAINGAAVGGWILAKTAGISFIDGLEVSEPVQLADGIAAGLAIVTVVLAFAAIAGFTLQGARRPSQALLSAWALAAAVMTVPAMLSAGSHQHANGHAHGSTVAETHLVVVPPHAYDPTKPIDLSGVDGVTLQQQAEAENLIAITLLRLPKFADTATAEAAGFHSIGDGVTGFEHFINQRYVADQTILDPDKPESLVYRVDRDGTRTLEAAMFMLPPRSTLDDVPDIGGKLMQWHIHNNLCFTPDAAAPRVAGLTNPDGTCNAPLVANNDPVPMIHVWIAAKPCGPFAALEGVGGGQVANGETARCDTVHGAP